MSSKLNVWSIITGHFNTLRSASTKKVSIADIFVFFIVPILIGIALAFYGFKLTNEANSLLMNFGAIFTALLLSVLVLVYDQGQKLTPDATTKKILLDELYDNICYSIVLSIVLVFLCIATSLSLSITAPTAHSLNTFVLTPLIMFTSTNLLLTILMIVKRMHALLTSSN
jgi:heme/copper-type cytochrome/quinol oxidase subunit 2